MKRNQCVQRWVLLAACGLWAAAGCGEGLSITPDNCVAILSTGDAGAKMAALRVAMDAVSFQQNFQPDEYENMKKALEVGFTAGASPAVWLKIITVSISRQDLENLIVNRDAKSLLEEIALPLAGRANEGRGEGAAFTITTDVSIFPTGLGDVKALAEPDLRAACLAAVRKLRLIMGAPPSLKQRSFADLATFVKTTFAERGFPALAEFFPRATVVERTQILKCMGLFLAAGVEPGPMLAPLRETLAGARARLKAIYRRYGADGMIRHRRHLLAAEESLVRTALDVAAHGKVRDGEVRAAIQRLADDVLVLERRFVFPARVQKIDTEALPTHPVDQWNATYEEAVRSLLDPRTQKDAAFAEAFQQFRYHTVAFTQLLDRSAFEQLPAEQRALFARVTFLYTPDDALEDMVAGTIPEDRRIPIGVRSAEPVEYVEIEPGEGEDPIKFVNQGWKDLVSLMTRAEEPLSAAEQELQQAMRAPGLSDANRAALQRELEAFGAQREDFRVLKAYVDDRQNVMPRYITRAQYVALGEKVGRSLVATPPVFSRELEAQCALTLKALGATDPVSQALIDRVDQRMKKVEDPLDQAEAAAGG